MKVITKTFALIQTEKHLLFVSVFITLYCIILHIFLKNLEQFSLKQPPGLLHNTLSVGFEHHHKLTIGSLTIPPFSSLSSTLGSDSNV